MITPIYPETYTTFTFSVKKAPRCATPISTDTFIHSIFSVDYTNPSKMKLVFLQNLGDHPRFPQGNIEIKTWT